MKIGNPKFYLFFLGTLILSSCQATGYLEVPVDWDSGVYCFATASISERFSDALDNSDIYAFAAITNDFSTIEITRSQKVIILEDGNKKGNFSDFYNPSKIRLTEGIYSGEECWLPQYFVEK